MIQKDTKVLVVVGAVLGGVICVFSSLIVLAFFPFVESIFPPKTYDFIKDILGPVAAGFGGAIAGVLTSHHIQTKAEEKKAEAQALEDKRKLNIKKASDYNKGVGILIAKYRDIANIKMQVVGPCAKDELRFLTMPISQRMPLNESKATDYLDELLIEESMGSILSRLMVVEQKYVATMSGVLERNDLILPYRAEFDAAIPRTHHRMRAGLSDVVLIHGCTRLLRLYSSSEGLIANIDETLSAFDEILSKLRSDVLFRIKLKDVNIVDFSNDRRAMTPTPVPYYKTVDELANAIGIDDSKSLAMRSWRVFRGDYSFSYVHCSVSLDESEP